MIDLFTVIGGYPYVGIDRKQWSSLVALQPRVASRASVQAASAAAAALS